MYVVVRLFKRTEFVGACMHKVYSRSAANGTRKECE